MNTPSHSVALVHSTLCVLLVLVSVQSAFSEGVTLSANLLWTNTHISVQAGESLRITASGSWNWGQALSSFGPGGDPLSPEDDWDLFYSGAFHGALIAYVGTDPFQGHYGDSNFFPQVTGYCNVGSSNQLVSALGGDLWLGFNDDAVSMLANDNTGYVTAQVDPVDKPVVLLVRGYGPANPSYWAAMSGLLMADGFEVWDASSDLDGTKSVSWNSACLRNFIERRLANRHGRPPPKRMSIIAHSMGGLITRAYLSEGPQVPIDCVIMLSPVNCGSWTANWVLGGQPDPEWTSWPWLNDLVPLLRFNVPRVVSTHDITTTYTLLFNAQHHLLPGTASGTRYYSIAGISHSKLPWRPLWAFTDPIIRTCIQWNWPGGGAPTEADLIHDGLVTTSSSWGIVGPAEAHAFCKAVGPGLPLNESIIQDRFGVVGFNSLVTVSDDHMSIIGDQALYRDTIQPLLQNAWDSNGFTSGTFAASPEENTQGEAPDTNTWSMLPAYSGTMASGSISNLVHIDSCSQAQFLLMWSTGTVSFTLVSPLGAVFTPSSPATNSDVQYVEVSGGALYSITNPPVGVWTAVTTLTGVGTNNRCDYFGLTSLANPLEFTVSCEAGFYLPNSRITITGTLTDSGVGMANAYVTGTIILPDGSTNQLTLADDGQHGDGVPGDGVYGGFYTNTTQTGLYRLNIVAAGSRANGDLFQRQGIGQSTFSVYAPTARFIDSYLDYPVDVNPGDGLYEQLVVDVAFQTTAPGTYSVAGTLTDNNGAELASANCDVTVTNTGLQSASLVFNSDSIYASKVIGGFQLRNLILVGTAGNLVPLDYRTNAYTTTSYDYRSFQGPPIILRQPASQNIGYGSNVSFTVSVTGVAPLDFQWYKNGAKLAADALSPAGATSATLALTNVTEADTGIYSVLITNALGQVMSSNAALLVVYPPVIEAGPRSQYASFGQEVTFNVLARGENPLTYQWAFNSTNIAGATTSTYTRTNVQSADTGLYSVVVSNVFGSVTSSAAALATIIAQWNFNGSPATTVPSVGKGTALLVGGITAAFAMGDTNTDPAVTSNYAWNTTTYPAQGVGNKTAGVQFNVDTSGRRNICVSWSERVSATASKYVRLQYKTNGTTFFDFPITSSMSAATVFETKSIDLSCLQGVNDNPNFAFRIVTEFDPCGNASYVTVSNSTYTTVGTVRFDMVTVSDSAAPLFSSPSSFPLLVSPVWKDTEHFNFSLVGHPGSQYVVQMATNLPAAIWIPLQTNTSPFIFEDANASGSAVRFYRALLLK